MRAGYYFGVSRFGSYLQQVRDYTSFTFVEAQTRDEDGNLAWWYHGSEAKFVLALKKAQRLGFKVHLSFQDSDPDLVVELAAPYWDAVELLDVMDEPPLKKKAMQQRVADIKTAVLRAGLRLRPVNAVFTASQLRTLNGYQATGLDASGFEVYVDPAYQGTVAKTVSEAKRIAAELLEILPDKPLVCVGQAYDRNGAWTNQTSLLALQDATYEAVRKDPRVQWIRWFSYGRKGGTLDHPALIPKHKAIAKKAGEEGV